MTQQKDQDSNNRETGGCWWTQERNWVMGVVEEKAYNIYMNENFLF